MTVPRDTRAGGAEIRAEAPADAPGVREVNAAAFGRDVEGRIVDALREQGALIASLVAIERERVVGHIAFSGATLAGSEIAALGPMAVEPSRQRDGIGSALVRAGLDACRRLGHDVVVVLGHPAFYPRFGFVPARPLGVTCEYPVPDEVFMVAELSPGALRGRRGVARYAAPFALADASVSAGPAQVSGRLSRRREVEPETDPLLSLRGSGRDLWAHEHADEYVRRLREGPGVEPDPPGQEPPNAAG